MAVMNSGLGGATGYGENSFTALGAEVGNLDDGSRFVDFSSVFDTGSIELFGENYSGLYINTNGLLTFGAPNTAYASNDIEGLQNPALVPFWTDINISAGGDIVWDLDPANGTFTITWLGVAPHLAESGTPTNSFQVVLTDTGAGNFDVAYIYEDIQFVNGSSSPGTSPATTGISDGADLEHELEGSGDQTALLGYAANDFDNGDPAGVFSFSVVDGTSDILSVDGSSGDDVIGAGFLDLQGNQVSDGNDLIDGGAGNDVIDGSSGNDTLLGGTGSDTIESGTTGANFGGSWNAVSHGDNLVGTSGQDFFSFGANTGESAIIRFNNSATAGDADGLADYVRIETTDAFNSLIIGDFDMEVDKIVLQETYSAINSAAGNGFTDVVISYDNGNSQFFRLFHDTGTFDAAEVFTTVEPVFGGPSDNDLLSGGDDADTFLISDYFGSDTVVGGEGGTDNDTLDLSGLNSAATISFTDSEAGSVTAAGHSLVFSEIENIILSDRGDSVDATSTSGGIRLDAGLGDDTLIGGVGDDTLLGGAGNDSIVAETTDAVNSGGRDLLDGGAGNDTLRADYQHGFSDTLLGGTGDDVLYDANGSHSLDGGDGNDTLLGSGEDGTAERDTLVGGDGDDLLVSGFVGTVNPTHGDDLSGGRGNDTLYGGQADDTLAGGDDADHIFIGDDFGADTVTGGEGVSTGVDNDRLDFSGMSGGISVTYSGDEFGFGTDGTDTLNFSQIEGLVLTAQADTVDGSASTQGLNIVSNAGDDSIIGSLGDDTFFGGDGGDTISGGDGSDYIDGGDGDDFLTTGLGEDTLIGGAGDDTLMNSDGDDSLVGGTGNDSIIATGGDDTLEGGSGDDTLDGGADNDSIEGGTGDDQIKTGTGDDYADGGDDADTFIIEDGFGNDTIIGGEGGADSDVIDLSALTGPVTVTFTDEEDGTITDGTDTITFSEIERLILTEHDDSVDASVTHSGQFGDHVGVDIDARGGNDTVLGGRGGDTIDGGSGNDSIVGDYGDDSLAAGDGNDTVSGGDGNDTIEGGAGHDSLSAGTEADTVDGGAGDDSIDGGSGDDQLHGGSGDDTIDGGSGDDTIDGGLDDDLLTGGGGDDVFVYAPNDGHDTITDFNAGNSGTLDDGDSTNNDFIDLSGFYDNLSELYADQADDGTLNQSNTSDAAGRSVDYSDNDSFGSGDGITFTGASADNSSFTAENTGVTCFTSGTGIQTPKGELMIDDLRVGDLVETLDNGAQPIAWIGRRRVGARELMVYPNLRPVRIRAGVLGTKRSLMVSQQHGILLASGHLARAKHLAETHPGVEVSNGTIQVTYFHLMFEAHQIIFADGAPAESFYPGSMAMGMLGAAARQQVLAIVPGLSPLADAPCPQAQDVYGTTARDFIHKSKIESVLAEVAATCARDACVPHIKQVDGLARVPISGGL